MINYSRQLLETAREVLASGYYDRQNMQPDDLAVFQRAIASRAPEAERFTFNEIRELIEIANSHDDRDPDYEWVDSNADSEPQENDEFDEMESFQEDEEASEASNEVDEEVDDPVARAREARRRACETANDVLNVYYPYKTLSAATDFDRFRALFAEREPDLAENMSDEELKMCLFSVGGTLIGQLRPREERLAEAKRRAANPDGAPRPRSYESVRPSSRVVPRSNVYDSCDAPNDSEQEAESPVNNEGADASERSLDAEAEAITRTFNSPRARLSQLRQNLAFRRTGAPSSDESNVGGYASDSNVGAPSQRYDGVPGGYPSRYGERPNYGERPFRQSYGSPYERQGYDRQNYDRYGAERRGYDRPDYGRSDYAERSCGSDRYNAPSRPYYNERTGGYSRYNGGYRSDGYSNGRSCDADPNGYSNNGRQGGYVNGGYRNSSSGGGYVNYGGAPSRAQGYSSLQEYRNTRGRASNDAFGANIGAPSQTPFNPADPSLADVVRATREILTNYFPNKQVGSGADIRRLRVFMSFKFPQANFSDEKLQMFVAYAGGSLLGSSQTSASERLLAATDYSIRKEEELRDVAAQILRFFPGAVVDETQGFEKFRVLFNARFDEGTVDISDETLKKIIRAVGGILPGQNETNDVNVDVDERFAALVDVARTVLETRFSHSVFKRDLSDFTRFRIQFERLVGPGATLDAMELRDVFVAAHGVFEEEPKPQEKPVVKLARSVMIKKVVAEYFPNGLDGSSHDDLDLFRQRAKEYDFNFDKETDVKLSAIVARCCVHYDDKLFAVSEEGRETIKSRVNSLFSVGTQIVYYETFFEKNAELLKQYNVGDAGFLVTLLANYFSNYLFYPDYFEKTECEDSERVKIMREIERVWGSADAMTPEALAERLCAPVDRIRKALEISVGNYAREGNAFVHAAAPSRSIVDDEELDDQFDAAFEKEEVAEEESDLNGENKVEAELDADEDREETTESTDAEQDDSEPSLFDMLLKEAEAENSPINLDDDEEEEEKTAPEEEFPQEELDARSEALAELLRSYFPEGFDVDSTDDLNSLKERAAKEGLAAFGSDAQIVEQIKHDLLLSGGRYFAITEDAKNSVGKALDEWFDAGGKLIYYAIFWKKRGSDLTEGGIFNENVLVDVMKEARPNFVYYDAYVEATKSARSEYAKVKEEILRVWTADVAKRASEFETTLYVPKATAIETFKNDSDFTSSSNGYWTKTRSKGAKAKSTKSATKKSASKKS